MPPDEFRHARRVLAVRLDNIGDCVMLGPGLRSLRAGLPDAEITLLASPAGSQAAGLLPWVDAVMTHRVVWQDVGGRMPLDPARERDLVRTIRRRGFDAAFLFTSYSQSPWPPAYACYLAGIPLRVGQSREFGGSLLTHAVSPPPDEAHQVDRNLHLLEGVGFDAVGRGLELAVPEEAAHAADALLAEAGVDPEEPFVAVAPGASCAARRYDPVRFGQAARRLAARLGAAVVIVAGPRETVIADAVLVAAGDRRVVSLAGRTTVAETAGVLRRAGLVLANDSGPMHIADALRRPMVVLFSGTDLESQWRPRTAPARLLRRPTDCAPCRRFTCPFGMACLDIPADEVAAHAEELWNRSLSSPNPLLPEPAACRP